ncbi:MAG: hypothetical protein R6V67_03990, partial [Spirochaetia bacterium]
FEPPTADAQNQYLDVEDLQQSSLEKGVGKLLVLPLLYLIGGRRKRPAEGKGGCAFYHLRLIHLGKKVLQILAAQRFNQ